MQTKIHKSIFTLAALLLMACSNQPQNRSNADFIVTIQPLKYIVEQITGNDFRVEVLVPPGASPETFEPTPKQFIALNEAKMVFSTGLIDFESALTEKMHNRNSIINLSHSIELIEGSCSHNHTAHKCDRHDCDHSHHAHHHGIDPHIWTSPRELTTMADNAYAAIIKAYPDSVKYTSAYNALITNLKALDEECARLCTESSAQAFAIYHPALTYFARTYNIEQIAIENDGKEPSAKHLANIIEQAKAKNVKCLLYQVQYPRSTVEILAKDMGIECYAFDPLAEDVITNIRNITLTITSNNNQ